MERFNGYKVRLLLIGVVAATSLGGRSAHAEDTWTRKADMPTTRYGLSTSVVGGKIYAIGGEGGLTRVDEYDPATDTWTKKADMPVGLWFPSTSVVNGKIYIMGGESINNDPVSIVQVYDPTTNTWAEQTELPTRRFWLSTSVVDGVIYVIGGSNANWSGMIHLDTVEAYDPSTDTWTPKANMPTGRSFLSSCVVDGKIYVVGGWVPGATTTVEAYDPATDTWTRKAPMPTARYLLGASVVGGKIYAIGGWRHSAEGPLYATVEVYDPVTDTWMSKPDMPSPTAGLSTSVVDEKIYAIGGTLTTHNGIFVHTSAVYEYYVAPSPDFNDDGIVDATDVYIMIEHWGKDYPLCDIGPTTWGDGIVDVQDLIVLVEHLFEEIRLPFELVAYWRLDEEEGDIAYDSAGDNAGLLLGGPAWRPDDGKKDGALEFNGVDDYVETDFILSPTDGAFSVFTWIKGDAAGQVIVSQTGAAGKRWLCTDPLHGKLMTGLLPLPGNRTPALPLESEAIITEGQWHHIGIVWDESRRYLYIDGVEVAQDASNLLAPLEFSDGGLYIGADKNLDAASFFSGLIDDVRIYNVALRAEKIEALAQ